MKTRNSHGLLQLHVGREALAYCQCLYRENKALFASVDLIGEKNQVILEWKLLTCMFYIESYSPVCSILKVTNLYVLYWKLLTCMFYIESYSPVCSILKVTHLYVLCWKLLTCMFYIESYSPVCSMLKVTHLYVLYWILASTAPCRRSRGKTLKSDLVHSHQWTWRKVQTEGEGCMLCS